MKKCTNSGRPLRSAFDGICYLLGDTFRIIDLNAAQDHLVTDRDLAQTLGQPKWDRVQQKLILNGFYESGRYRIEVWS